MPQTCVQLVCPGLCLARHNFVFHCADSPYSGLCLAFYHFDSADSAVLQVLLLDSNMLTELPTGIGQLSRLERLSVAHNSLAALPASLGQLQKLQVSRLQLRDLEGCCTHAAGLQGRWPWPARETTRELAAQSKPRGLQGQMLQLSASPTLEKEAQFASPA